MTLIVALKIVTATLIVVGVVVSFLDIKYARNSLVLESSPKAPLVVIELAGLGRDLCRRNSLHRSRLLGFAMKRLE
jgi:hypothetical protein